MPPPADPETLRERQRIGDRIRSIRLGRGMSQEALAEGAGVDRKTISRAENGRHPYDVDTAIRIAKALRVPTFWLFTDDWDTKPGQSRPEPDSGV